jgi:hypothetical protein
VAQALEFRRAQPRAELAAVLCNTIVLGNVWRCTPLTLLLQFAVGPGGGCLALFLLRQCSSTVVLAVARVLS